MSNEKQIQTETASAVTEYFTLADLYVSDLNPRKDVDEEGIALLAESLEVCGLIQNLVGLRDPKGKKVGIVAGGRRLRALQIAALARPDLALVPVKLAPNAHVAEEWANAENTAREELDAVDEVRAYGKMAEKALSLGKIAAAFGVTEAHVRRRLALSKLPAPVLDALKAGDISLGTAKAMTVSDDEDKILEVLERAKGSHWFNEHQVKQMLKPDAKDGDGREARFVGLEAYEAAGGTITRDLFEDEVLLNEPDLLEALFSETLTEQAETLRKAEGWAWVETSEDSNPFWYEIERERGFVRVHKIEGEWSEKQAARHDELTELAEGDVLDDAGQIELDALDAVLEGDYSPEQKAHAGLLVYVTHNGQIKAMYGLIKPEDQPAAVEAGVLEVVKAESAKPAKPKPAFSQKFMDDMTAIRLAAVQTALLDKPDYLLSLFAFAVSPASGSASVFGFGYGSLDRNAPEIDSGFVLDARLGGQRNEAEEAALVALEEMAGTDSAKSFKAFRDVGKKLRNGAVTSYLARAFKVQRPAFMADIESEIGADIRSIWTPNAENCFKRLNGGQLEALLQTLLGIKADSAEAIAFSKQKKGGKVEVLDKLFNDPEAQKLRKLTPEQTGRINTWVPECFG